MAVGGAKKKENERDKKKRGRDQVPKEKKKKDNEEKSGSEIFAIHLRYTASPQPMFWHGSTTRSYARMEACVARSVSAERASGGSAEGGEEEEERRRGGVCRRSSGDVVGLDFR